MFLREDALRGSLQQAYTGPHEVILRKDKYFIIKVKGKDVTVSVDRLKPAYILKNDSSNVPESKFPITTTSPNFKTTRSGRQVKSTDFYRP